VTLRSLTALVAALGTATQTAAAECVLEKASYADDRGFEVRFSPIDPHALSTSNVFELVLPTGKEMHGEVVWGNGESRPIGYLRHGCAPDEVDFGKLEACTHWEGIVYGVTRSRVGMLPRGDEPAPEQIILANLGQVLRYSLAFTDLAFHEVPGDVFTLTGCRP
jgi:hypothetical protein